jgi:hypothetical protein
MRTIAWTISIAIAFTIGLNIRQPTTTHHYETFVRTDTITQPSTADQLLDVLIRTEKLNPDLDVALAYECTMALIRQTGDDLAATIAYIQRRYQGDSCTALKVHQEQGYY